jgi:ABC-type sulfate transport system substrate-binding protein
MAKIRKKEEEKMADINRKVLNEVNKGATMGMDAISYVTDKVEDEKFKKVLNVEYNKYRETFDKVNEIYNEYGEGEPQETNKMNKMMTWYGVQMKTMNDQSNSKISELLLQGTNMGIIEGRRLLNNNPSIEPKVRQILDEFVVMQEDSVETLKKYL